MSKNSERTILVTGATGKQGGTVYRHLQEKGYALRAMTRTPDSPAARRLVGSGQDVVQGNYDDLPSISAAVADTYGVFSVQQAAKHAEEEIRQGTSLIDAANRADTQHFVYSSVASADQNTGIPHFDSKYAIETHLQNSGLAYTIFRPVFFMENWLMYRDGITNGQMHGPLKPETRLQMVAVDDIGAFVAMAFDHSGRWHNRIFELAGDTLSMAETAEAFSRVSGREVKYVQIPWEDFEKQAGPEFTTMYRWFENVGYHVDIESVREAYPRLTGFNRWLETHWTNSATQTA